jgi:quercetin dioxygenase-like cupin family protein
MVQEARLERLETGLAPVTDGWFVVGIAEAAWMTNDALGAACIFESDDVSFPDVGFTLAVIRPGQPAGMYHREANQENFLVLTGECVLLIEGQERPLRAWDFVHCPPDTEHGFVGAGDGPCVIFMTGARKGWPERGTVYVGADVARSHGAGAEVETTSSAEAYAPFPKWRLGPPPSWDGLPWA